MSLAQFIAVAATAASTYSSYKAGKAQEKASDQQISGAYEQIEYVKEAALIEDIGNAEAAIALKEKTGFDLQTVDRREAEILAASKSNEEEHIKNLGLLGQQVGILKLQRQREISKAEGTSRARAAGAGIAAGGGAAAEVRKDISFSGALEQASINLQASQAEERLNEEIGKSRRDVYIALQNSAADREVLNFNYRIAERQQQLSLDIGYIERDMKISSLRSGAQVIQAGQTGATLPAFTTALRGIGAMTSGPNPLFTW